jgi:hypothetical protein
MRGGVKSIDDLALASDVTFWSLGGGAADPAAGQLPGCLGRPVSQAPRFSTSLASARLSRSQAS